MLNISGTTQIAITKDDARVLKKELEALFVAGDGIGGGFYSLTETEKKYPLVVELFKTI